MTPQDCKDVGRSSWLLSTENLNLSFGGVQALHRIDISVGQSEVLAIIGPNGAGKTCLLNCLSGFYHPQIGRIYFRNQEITHLRPHKRAMLGIGRTFQGVQLFAGLTVVDNLLTGRHIYMKTSAIQDFIYHPWSHREEMRQRRKIEDIIDFLEIKHVRYKLVESLSYGLRKRVDLARALAMEPKVLLMDEPMAGMNLEEKEDMARFVMEIRKTKDIPIVIIEHDMHVVMDISDRIYVLNWGHTIAEGKPVEIRKNQEVIKAYLGEELAK
jgi:branched-chain amino acid transport system ATP-binding protein